MNLGGIYLSVSAKTTKLKSDLAKAQGMTKKAAVLMNHEIKSVSFNQVKLAALVGVAALTAFTAKVVSVGRDFESTMKTVQAWSGATGDALKDLTDKAREMGATTEYTATEAAGALKFLAAAGFSAEDSISALPGALDLATAGQVDLAVATDITTDVLTAFGLNVEELGRVNDAFITTTSNSNTNVTMLGQSMKMVAPTAKLMGLSVEETAALLGTLANSGVKAEMAGSGLNMVLLKSQKAAKMLGMELDSSLIDVLERMKDEQWDAITVGEAFGARQIKTAGILMNNIGNYENLTKKIYENVGATQELAEIIRDSLDNDIKILNSTIEEELLRTFDNYNGDMRDIIQSTTEWIRQNPQMIDELAQFTEEMSEVAIIFAKVIVFGVQFVNVWSDTFKALGLASAGLITVRTALFNGSDAVEKFGSQLGRSQLQAKKLKDELSELDSWREFWSNKETLAYNTKLKQLDRLNKQIIDDSKKQTETQEKVAEDAVKVEKDAVTKKIALINKEEKERIASAKTSSKKIKESSEQLYYDMTVMNQVFGDEAQMGSDALVKMREEQTQASIDLYLEETEAAKKASEDSILAYGSFFDGFSLGMAQAIEDTQTWAEQGQEVAKNMSSNMSSSLSDGFFAILTGDMEDIGDIWEGFLNDMLTELTDTVAEMAVSWGLSAASDLVSGWWDTGAWNIKEDHVAMVHKGEMIVPAETANQIRDKNSNVGEAWSDSNVSGGTAADSPQMDFLSDLAVNFGESMGGNSLTFGATGISKWADGTISGSQLLDGLTSMDALSSIAQQSLFSGLNTTLSEYLGLDQSNWSSYGSLFGKYLGGSYGGMAGGVIGNLIGGYLGTAIGDATDTRKDEGIKDLLEDKLGWAAGIKAYSDATKADAGGTYDEDYGSDAGVTESYESTPGTDAMGGYAKGGLIDNLIAPGEDGLASLQFGEGVVSKKGMSTLDKLNSGKLFGSGITIGSLITVNGDMVADENAFNDFVDKIEDRLTTIGRWGR